MKLYIYITDPDRALKNDFSWGLYASTIATLSDGRDWFLAGNVEVEIAFSPERLTESCIQKIDYEANELRAKLELLEQKKMEYLALTHFPAEE